MNRCANHLYLGLSALHPLVYHCVNADDTGAPKTAIFGGVQRGRISSQSLKHAWRADGLGVDDGCVRSERTRILDFRLRQLLRERHTDEEIKLVLGPFLARYLGADPVKGRTKIVIPLGQDEFARLANILHHNWDVLATEAYENARLLAGAMEAEELSKATAATNDTTDAEPQKRCPAQKTKASKAESLKLKWPAIDQLIEKIDEDYQKGSAFTEAIDIALFGRMLANKHFMDVDAACSVAHMISTHRIDLNTDWWITSDDIVGLLGETGAAMMDSSIYSSATYYKYASLDWTQLVSNLRGDTNAAMRATTALLNAFVTVMPTGKQHATAPYTPPILIFGLLRRGGQPWSLANAFETPIRPQPGGGYALPSALALLDQYKAYAESFGLSTVERVAVHRIGIELRDLDLAEYVHTDSITSSIQAWVGRLTEALPVEGL